MFDSQSPSSPPDIIFQEDNSFLPVLDNIQVITLKHLKLDSSVWLVYCFNPPLQSYVDWDVSDAQSLVSLVEEILAEYRRHQLTSLSSRQPVEFQYTTLKESYNEQLIDVQCLTVSRKCLMFPLV